MHCIVWKLMWRNHLITVLVERKRRLVATGGGANCKAISFSKREEEVRANLRDLGSNVAILDPGSTQVALFTRIMTQKWSCLCSKEIAWAPRSPAFSEYLETAFRLTLKKYKEKKIGEIRLKWWKRSFKEFPEFLLLLIPKSIHSENAIYPSKKMETHRSPINSEQHGEVSIPTKQRRRKITHQSLFFEAM